ncbi:MAG: DUF5818 domain-containing protein [Sphingobium sp.]|uniref:DUF5818 domain-containing protein n=1 Tax=Sphingobium sp. TaxID=1912891 RepID=UPI0029AB82B9|nr:DUF5818 domain-containing protein [Sphingobium sp.]MDX3911588.1 DUF5818 domain-containing protein [Sphingobium sp.]
MPGSYATLMPRFKHYELTGVLLVEGRQFVLSMPGGGTWRLEVTRSPAKLLGQRVTVMGTRDGFDLIAVTSIAAA